MIICETDHFREDSRPLRHYVLLRSLLAHLLFLFLSARISQRPRGFTSRGCLRTRRTLPPNERLSHSGYVGNADCLRRPRSFPRNDSAGRRQLQLPGQRCRPRTALFLFRKIKEPLRNWEMILQNGGGPRPPSSRRLASRQRAYRAVKDLSFRWMARFASRSTSEPRSPLLRGKRPGMSVAAEEEARCGTGAEPR